MERETRGKTSKTGASAANANLEEATNRPQLSTREEELLAIERSMHEKELRLRAQEKELRSRLDEMDAEKRKFEREKDTFSRNLEARENEVAAKERDMEKKWPDNSDLTGFEPSHPLLHHIQVPHVPYDPNYQMYNNGTHDASPKVSFRDATDSVPSFDGYNIPLAQFTRACRRARDIVPPSSERNLTKLLLNKLRGRAYYAVEDEPCSTVTELIDLLTGAFGSSKTLDQYRGELSTIYLKPGEHVLDYISRVKDLRTNILDIERRTKRCLDSHFLSEIDGLTSRSFYEGLPLEYRLQIGPETRQRHTDAFAAAKAIAKRQELDKLRYEPRYRSNYERGHREMNIIGRPLAHSTPERPGSPRYQHSNTRASNPRDNDYRYNRERAGVIGNPRDNDYRNNRERAGANQSPRDNDYHYNRNQARANGNPSDNNYRYDRNQAGPSGSSRDNAYRYSNNRTEANERPRNTSPAEKVCRYCKYPGHVLEECRKRQYNNARKTESGNMNSPPGPADAARSDERKNLRPINTIQTQENSMPESQS